jgi:uncharacterized protein with NRDE domain
MCLLSVASNAHPEYPFVFAGNRDEFHARASAAADWWDDAPAVLGGRDLVAGGSWLGINRDGRFAVVTNRPDLPAPENHALSRGALVAEQLTGDLDPSVWAQQLAADSQRYGGFSLLAGNVTAGGLNCYNGGNGMQELQTMGIESGVFGLSNTALDAPWPKLTWLNSEINRLLGEAHADIEALFALLLRREPVPDADTDWVSARPFIVGDDYGTRSATVITVDRQGECRFIERRFGQGGVPAGDTDECFTLSPSQGAA